MPVATSPDYDKIKAAMINPTPPPRSQAFKGTYTGDPSTALPRKFLAYVLGDGHDTGAGAPLEVVLAFQYEGHNTDTDPAKNWRCFQVQNFVGNAGSKLDQIDFNPSPSITPPLLLNGHQLARQNCVARGINGTKVTPAVQYHA